MTITFAAYTAPAGWERPVAVAAVLALAAVNYFGVTRTAFLARIIVLLVLAVIVAAGVSSGLPAAQLADASSPVGSGARGILQSGVWVVMERERPLRPGVRRFCRFRRSVEDGTARA